MTGFAITVGEQTYMCSGGRLATEINEPDKASGRVGAHDLAERGTDWAGPARITIDNEDVMHGRIVMGTARGRGCGFVGSQRDHAVGVAAVPDGRPADRCA
jgi:hypothetical protein